MNTITVQPVKGRKVRDPENNYAPILGPTEVVQSAFWTRRIADGDVTIVQDTKKAKTPK